MQTDQFETVLPKTERFFSPKIKSEPKPQPSTQPKIWGGVIGGLIVGAFLAGVHQLPHQAPVAPVVAPTPAPAPVPLDARRAMPIPVFSAPSAPRAELLHVRAIGTTSNVMMPDGRTLFTTYRGELPSAANLPRHGAMGDMWFTRNDTHCWVLAPIAAGSQVTGWVDP